MIHFVEGIVVEKQPTRVVIETGGLGYEIFIPLSSYDRIPSKGASCRVLTYDYVREDTRQLFGFVTENEREMFTLLMGASGIGPKLALSALSGLTVRDIKKALIDNDVKTLSSISGIGKKMAERIIVELRDKIGEGEALEAVAGPEGLSDDARNARDAVLALVALGYKQETARKMINAVLSEKDAPSDVETIVKIALGGTRRGS